MSDERHNSITASNHKITSELNFYGTKTRVKFSGSSFKQDKVTYSHGTIENIYIVYEISKHYSISVYPTLENCLFGAVSFTKMLILINTNILGMALDLIDMVNLVLVLEDLVETA